MSDQTPDEEEEDTIDQVRQRFPGVCGFKRSGSFFLDVLDAKMRINTNGQPPQNSGSGASLGPVFQWQAGGSSLLMYWNKVVLSYGKKVVLQMDEEGIAMEADQSALKITEDGITLSYGTKAALTLDEEGVTLSMGETLLRLTEAGITTTGDMTTSGVHTDANGTHESTGGGGLSA